MRHRAPGVLSFCGCAIMLGAAPGCIISPNGTNGTTRYSLSLDTGDEATVTLDPPGGTYDAGTWVTITVESSSGGDFVQILWADGSASSSDNPLRIRMDENRSGRVVLTSPGAYALRVFTYDRGVVFFDPPGGVYVPGTQVTITCSFRQNESFVGIEWDDGTVDYEYPMHVTMDADKSGTLGFAGLGLPTGE